MAFIITFVKRLPLPFLRSLYHFLLAFCGAVRYGFPSRKLVVIGVTGTNGKSTVVYCVARLLEASGLQVAASSSIEFQIKEKRWANMHKMTMPGRFFLQKFLRDAVSAGCTHAVIEVTSEGILQHRHAFIDWDVAVFLNLSPEHIERHGGYEKYREAKGKLFAALKLKNQSSPIRQAQGKKIKTTHSISSEQANKNPKSFKTSIVNMGDKEAEYFLQFPADHCIGFRMKDVAAVAQLPVKSTTEFVAELIRGDGGGSEFTVSGVSFKTSLPGVFNIENWLAVLAVGFSQRLSLERMAGMIAKVASIPGRLEEIPNNRGIRVFVDYAHTPAALRSVYATLLEKFKILNPKSETNHKPQDATPKLICVLGAAGGGRDKWKRPEFGKLAAAHCDTIILANEDPYDEEPNRILTDIELGIKNYELGQRKYEKILDRREAITKAIAAAQSGDIIIITGKGCEPWMMVEKGKKIPWSDREIVQEALRVA